MWVAFAVAHIFSGKNIRILYTESAKTVNEMTLNKLVKLTTLWTTGPWALISTEADDILIFQTNYVLIHFFCFVCLEFNGSVNTINVMLSRSVYLTTLFQGRLNPQSGSPELVHLLLPETDNCASWISGRERMTVQIIQWLFVWGFTDNGVMSSMVSLPNNIYWQAQSSKHLTSIVHILLPGRMLLDLTGLNPILPHHKSNEQPTELGGSAIPLLSEAVCTPRKRLSQVHLQVPSCFNQFLPSGLFYLTLWTSPFPVKGMSG